MRKETILMKRLKISEAQMMNFYNNEKYGDVNKAQDKVIKLLAVMGVLTVSRSMAIFPSVVFNTA